MGEDFCNHLALQAVGFRETGRRVPTLMRKGQLENVLMDIGTIEKVGTSKMFQ